MALKSIVGATCTCLAVVSFNVNSALWERLGGLAYYDDESDLTWLADASAGTGLNWVDAKNWAAELNIDGVTGWRLPDTQQPDATCSIQTSTKSSGYNCTGSELGNLFYNVLGGSADSGITSVHNDNYFLFNNVQDTFYFSATEYGNVGEVWVFATYNGYQDTLFANLGSNSWAVHSGDVSAVPIPAAIWLFGSSLIGLIGFARRKM